MQTISRRKGFQLSMRGLYIVAAILVVIMAAITIVMITEDPFSAFTSLPLFDMVADLFRGAGFG